MKRKCTCTYEFRLLLQRQSADHAFLYLGNRLKEEHSRSTDPWNHSDLQAIVQLREPVRAGRPGHAGPGPGQAAGLKMLKNTRFFPRFSIRRQLDRNSPATPRQLDRRPPGTDNSAPAEDLHNKNPSLTLSGKKSSVQFFWKS